MQSPDILRKILRASPGQWASKEERLRLIRRSALSSFPGVVAVWVVVLDVGMPAWGPIALGMATAIGLESVASLTWRIRRLSER